MKRIILFISFLIIGSSKMYSQNDSIFCNTIYNNENNIYLKIDFYQKNITIKGQEFMGEMAGFMGDEKDYRKWLILDAEIINTNTAVMEISNDEGSEDLNAELTFNPDGTYTLKQLEGSTLKIARNRKWKKLPKTLVFAAKRD